jgi:hypothetical protein
MPGLVPKIIGMKRAYFKTKRGEIMNTSLSGTIEGVLSRSEMKHIMAGDPQVPGEGDAFIRCDNCQNSSCEGWEDDCETGGLEICGPGYAGSGGPGYTCIEVN